MGRVNPSFTVAVITAIAMLVLGAPWWAIVMTMGIFFFAGDAK